MTAPLIEYNELPPVTFETDAGPRRLARVEGVLRMMLVLLEVHPIPRSYSAHVQNQLVRLIDRGKALFPDDFEEDEPLDEPEEPPLRKKPGRKPGSANKPRGPNRKRHGAHPPKPHALVEAWIGEPVEPATKEVKHEED